MMPLTKRVAAQYYGPRVIEWETPPQLFDVLDAEFGFTLDVCASPENAKCERYFTRADNALMQRWEGVCWMNPPYGREIAEWMAKAYDAAVNGATVVCLIPSRTDTSWWHDYAMNGEIRFLRGRVRFIARHDTGPESHNAPFASAIVIFRPGLPAKHSPQAVLPLGEIA